MVAGGSSGGPLMSEAGEVIGMIAFNLPDQGISFAAHVGHLIELMDRSRCHPGRGCPASRWPTTSRIPCRIFRPGSPRCTRNTAAPWKNSASSPRTRAIPWSLA